MSEAPKYIVKGTFTYVTHAESPEEAERVATNVVIGAASGLTVTSVELQPQITGVTRIGSPPYRTDECGEQVGYFNGKILGCCIALDGHTGRHLLPIKQPS